MFVSLAAETGETLPSVCSRRPLRYCPHRRHPPLRWSKWGDWGHFH